MKIRTTLLFENRTYNIVIICMLQTNKSIANIYHITLCKINKERKYRYKLATVFNNLSFLCRDG